MSAFIEHLTSYPSVTQAVDFAKSFAAVQKAGAISKPYVDTLTEKTAPLTNAIYSKAQPTLSKADEFGDKVLSNLDSRFPAIKTAQPSDLVSEVKHRFDGAKASVGSTASSVKSKYAQVYDTNGKPYIEGIESRIAPLNDKFDGAIETYLPGEAKAADASSELSRTYALALKLFGRLKPAAGQLRSTTLSHVQSVYSKELEHQAPLLEDLSIHILGKPITIKLSLTKDVAAAIKTGFALGYESYSKLFEYASRSPAGKKAASTIESAKESVSEHASKSEDALSSAVDNAKAEAKSLKKKSKAKAEVITQEAQAAVY